MCETMKETEKPRQHLYPIINKDDAIQLVREEFPSIIAWLEENFGYDSEEAHKILERQRNEWETQKREWQLLKEKRIKETEAKKKEEMWNFVHQNFVPMPMLTWDEERECEIIENADKWLTKLKDRYSSMKLSLLEVFKDAFSRYAPETHEDFESEHAFLERMKERFEHEYDFSYERPSQMVDTEKIRPCFTFSIRLAYIGKITVE